MTTWLSRDQLKQLGREYFIDMLGVDDITRTVEKEIQLAYEKEENKRPVWTDGVIVIEFIRESTWMRWLLSTTQSIT